VRAASEHGTVVGAGDTETMSDDGRSPAISDFHRLGYVLLPGLLTPDDVARAGSAADRAVRSPSGPSCERPHNTLVPLRWNDPLVDLVVTRQERIRRAIGAEDLRWISGYVSVKEQHSPPLWWHQDWWAWDHPVSLRRDAPQVALLCYLSDTTATSGALRVIPGSHAVSGPLHAILPQAHSDESAALPSGHPALADHADQVTLELAAGDAVVTDYRLLHGTHAHRATHRRDCLLLSFTPDWSGLPFDIRAHLIQHPALPGPHETARGGVAELLPTYRGARHDLRLNRDAPTSFALRG
jgi:hypothetical protein